MPGKQFSACLFEIGEVWILGADGRCILVDGLTVEAVPLLVRKSLGVICRIPGEEHLEPFYANLKGNYGTIVDRGAGCRKEVRQTRIRIEAVPLKITIHR